MEGSASDVGTGYEGEYTLDNELTDMDIMATLLGLNKADRQQADVLYLNRPIKLPKAAEDQREWVNT